MNVARSLVFLALTWVSVWFLFSTANFWFLVTGVVAGGYAWWYARAVGGDES